MYKYYIEGYEAELVVLNENTLDNLKNLNTIQEVIAKDEPVFKMN